MPRPLLFCAALLAAAPAGATEPFTVVLLGDIPYGAPAEVYPQFETLIDAIDARAPDLVIHVGDTKSGASPCTDAVLADQRAYLDRFAAPVLYTPGDNEWTDCHAPRAGGHDPLERLARIRATYFDAPERSFGRQPLALAHQGERGYPENVRLTLNGVTIVTAHVVGSNNGFEPRDTAAAAEFLDRDAANIAWLREGFAAAEAAGARALILAIHANMFEFGFGTPWAPEAFLRHSGFRAFAEALAELSNGFARPVLLMHGDSHVFRLTRPMPRRAPWVMALETFGAADMHAVEVRVTPDDPFPFAVQPLLNPAVPLARPD